MSAVHAHRQTPLRYLLIAVVVFWVLSHGMPTPSTVSDTPSLEPQPPHHDIGATTTSLFLPSRSVEIVRVVDGDTVRVRLGGKEEVVRLIGVNAPESVDPRRGVECFGKEAAVYLRVLLETHTVRFGEDETQDTRDKYGRLLGYLILPDGSTVNERMIADGYAYEYTYRVPYLYQAQFRASAALARREERGLYHDGACGLSNTMSTPAPIPALETPMSTTTLRCDQNVYDCKAFSTQREAQSLFLACGGPREDPHRLDVDRDGVVCETLP